MNNQTETVFSVCMFLKDCLHTLFNINEIDWLKLFNQASFFFMAMMCRIALAGVLREGWLAITRRAAAEPLLMQLCLQSPRMELGCMPAEGICWSAELCYCLRQHELIYQKHLSAGTYIGVVAHITIWPGFVSSSTWARHNFLCCFAETGPVLDKALLRWVKC